ncbi:MAG TPA: agmatinase family protein [Candidatus Binataceae bacterium]|nr:agmatinase family protein [Candidatus Binataceae bacterium]
MAGIEGPFWKLRADLSKQPKREPGPINLQRYTGSMAYSGIATFMGLPLALTPEDLKAGKVEVAIVGAPVDTSFGHRGAQYGPRYIRADERTVPYIPAMLQNPDTRVKPFEVLTVVDYGDAAVDPLDLKASCDEIRGVVKEIAATGAVPIVLGGDHTILWPDAAAIADVYGPGKVGVVHFDCHVDCAESVMGHNIAHGTPIRRLIQDEHVPGKNFVQVGLHSFLVPDDELLAWMLKNGLRSHHMAEIERLGFDAVLNRAIDEALDGPEYLYVSVDVDVMDPAFAPGTGTPEPGGLTPREILPAIRRICHETPVVGFEVVEVAPLLDPGITTVMNARRIILEALTGLAQRKLGIKEKNYLDPVMAGKTRSMVRGTKPGGGRSNKK